jgi:hypothetical protein
VDADALIPGEWLIPKSERWFEYVKRELGHDRIGVAAPAPEIPVDA